MIVRRAVLAGACALVLLGPGAAAASQPWDPRSNVDARDARDARRSGDAVSMSAAREAVLRQYPGARYIDATTVFDRQGRPYEHHVLIVTRQGRRVAVRVDARHGHVLGEVR